MTNRYDGHSAGYTRSFDQVELFPERMADAASWGPPSAADRADKPWLAGCRRLILVSDMSDSLSDAVPFAYLAEEIVKTVVGVKGRRHIYLPEAAEEIGCSRRFLEKTVERGELKVFRPSSRIVRVRRAEFEKWIEQHSLGGNDG